MNKKLLSLAVASALISGAAHAVDLDDNSAVGTAASEILFSGSSTTVASTAAGLDVVTSAIGFGIPANDTYYIRFDLSNATFGTAVANGDLTLSTAGTQTIVISAGGTDGASNVIFAVSTDGNAAVAADTLTLAGIDDFDVASKADVGITYAMYETAGNAVNQTSALATSNGTLLQFSAATSVDADSVTAKQIDVTNNSTVFVGSGTCSGVPNTLCNTILDADVAEVTGTQGIASDIDGTDLTLAAALANTTVLTVSGDFTAVQDLTNNAPDGTYTLDNVYIDNNGGCDNKDTNATTITDTAATFVTADAANGAVTHAHAFADAAVVCMEVNGVGTIAEQSFTATWTPAAETGYTLSEASLTGATLSKNGSSTSLNFLLTPGGAFSNFVRISNTSSITGDVFITLYSDSGDSVVVDLGDINGIDSSTLAGQASTELIKIEDLYAAAQAADATFAVDGDSEKLRAVIEGEFSSITAEALTLSTDSTTFATF